MKSFFKLRKRTLRWAPAAFCWAVVVMSGVAADTKARSADLTPTTSLASLVNPFVGTDHNGNTFPGAVAPFGMMQLSPNLENNGYYYTNTRMHGFVVNLMSGDGGANEGQVLIAATTGPVKVDRSSTDFQFDHDHESASAGYYQVLTQPWGVNVEATTTTRCGMMRYTFPAGKQANILLPISYANTPTLSAEVHCSDNETVTGQVTSEAFGGDRHGIPVYFVMKFSHPFTNHGTWTNDKIEPGVAAAAQNDRHTIVGFYGSYPASEQARMVEVRIGMSYVDLNGAMANLKSEIPDGGDFDRYRYMAARMWNSELSLIDVQGGTAAHRRVFYTALYHALIAPSIFDDVDGRYTGFDGKIHTVSSGHKHYYATFSGWDIYRTQIPLLGIIEPARAGDMAQSIVDMAKQIGYIDRWPQLNQPCAVMNGDPLTISLVNLWNAGIRNFDMDEAYRYMWKQSQTGDPRSHIGVYQGFDEERKGVTLNADASVASCLEYDVAFAALGRLARSLNKLEDANYLFGRALQYREMYNPATGYLQGKDASGGWDRSFGGYTEGNREIYLWFVPHDVQGLVDLMGGASSFDRRLDIFFDKKFYDPTNEPDIQAPFLYDYINRPWKTQKLVAETADYCFTDTPGGLANGGNDDLGTMSSWYVLSQLGFYPVDPGVPNFVVCTPRFPKAIIRLGGPQSGKKFVIETPAASPANMYIQSASLNGRPLTNPWFSESAITEGGAWTVQVSDEPNRSWGSDPFGRPGSLSCGDGIPYPNNPVVKTLIPTGQNTETAWRYTTKAPSADWFNPAFSDGQWKQGLAGFGTEDEGVTPRTPWATEDIWMRHTFTLSNVPRHSIAIYAYHDQDIEVYVNGVTAATGEGWTHDYAVLPMSPAARAALHTGKNTMAVHVRHPGDGRHFADAGLVELEWPEAEK